MAVFDAVLDTLTEGVLGPLAVAGIAASLLASPRSRRTLRRWAVRGAAATMVAADLASRRARAASTGTGGVARQLGYRVVQAASEVREEWEDFLAEARTLRDTQKGNEIPVPHAGGEGEL